MITTGAIPEREEKTLHSVARMMLANSTRAIPGGGGERRELLAFIADLVEMLREASALVSEGRPSGSVGSADRAAVQVRRRRSLSIP